MVAKGYKFSPESLKSRSEKLKKFYIEYPEKKPVPPSRKGQKQPEGTSDKLRKTLITRYGPPKGKTRDPNRTIRGSKEYHEKLRNAHLKYYNEHNVITMNILRIRK